MSDKNGMCPCGSGKAYSECCEPIIKGTALAKTAEELMRARYSAYEKHEIDFIVESCESTGTEKDIDYDATKAWSEESNWYGLKILRTEKGGENDTEGVVEFEATYSRKGLKDVHHETGYFKKIDGKWLYSTGNLKTTTVVREGRKIGRNEPCPCGSGKKYKVCCGR
ncbi:MAG: YchJ family protein [Candidatus Treponema excrementipullorum]|nr:YchJ family protein [Spirochaetia bacterium]MDY2754979.1 YchJ family protein [Candidatus Treponema excrementipullorum]MDY4465557.1 YchJ family protein [Candidatus Treponema excrementipullorum]